MASKLLGMLNIVFLSVTFLLFVITLPFAALVNAIRGPRKSSKISIGFFHPYCNAGGGGERVLWTAVKCLQDKYGASIDYVIYTGDTNVTSQQIMQLTEKRFNIKLDHEVRFVFLNQRDWVEDKRYPMLTMIGQSLGSLILAFEAYYAFVPDIFFDSMGYAFTFPIFKVYGRCKIGCYVHYPTISTDMLEAVKRRETSFNNNSVISQSPFFSNLKLFYYKLFAWLYGVMGSYADVVMVNSTWTKGHIDSIWGVRSKSFKVFPPCDTQAFQGFPLESRQKIIVSVGQFRPEKNHRLQLESLALFLKKHPEHKDVQLVLIGSSRNREDEERIALLRQAVIELQIQDSVKFAVNATFDELKDYLRKGLIGIHTMFNEHFGIGIVEYMAAGLVPLAHKSGGPLMDIVTIGYLAQTAEEYADNIYKILSLDENMLKSIQNEARKNAVSKFSEENFNRTFLMALGENFFKSQKIK